MPQKTLTRKAGLDFAVGRVKRRLQEFDRSQRITTKAAVRLAATLETLVVEVLDGAIERVKAKKRKRIMPRDIMFAFENDPCLSALTAHVDFMDPELRLGSRRADIERQEKHLRESRRKYKPKPKIVKRKKKKPKSKSKPSSQRKNKRKRNRSASIESVRSRKSSSSRRSLPPLEKSDEDEDRGELNSPIRADSNPGLEDEKEAEMSDDGGNKKQNNSDSDAADNDAGGGLSDNDASEAQSYNDAGGDQSDNDASGALSDNDAGGGPSDSDGGGNQSGDPEFGWSDSDAADNDAGGKTLNLEQSDDESGSDDESVVQSVASELDINSEIEGSFGSD